MERFIKGADVSSLLDVEECGGRFYDQSLVTSHQGTETKPSPWGEGAPVRTLGRMRGRRIPLPLPNSVSAASP